jgi:predicted dehydrogenase
MKYKMIQVGCGGFGSLWCSTFLPANVKDGLIEVVAAVDINPEALKIAKQHLGLNDSQCYTDMKKAFDENKADFCTIVVPPAFHEKVVDLALSHNMHILSEKPIADTMEGSLRIANKIKQSGKKMGITMSHRFAQDKTTLRQILRKGEYGKLDYIVCRFTCNCRKFGSWGKFRHEMKDPLLVEGSVHHLDIIADLTDSKCDTIYAKTWNPKWGEYAGDSQGLVTMSMQNNTKAFYEGAKSNAKSLNCWCGEYFRAECEGATIILDFLKIVVLLEGKEPKEIPFLQQPKWMNTWLIEKYVKWLDGGEPMETNVEDNLQSVALVFSAIESSETGKPVKVQEFLNKYKKLK